MPYIDLEDRRHYEDAINLIVSRLAQRNFAVGDINYAITMILKKVIRHKGRSYADYNAVIGVLECIKQEFYRRDVAEYEEEKIALNGDLE